MSDIPWKVVPPEENLFRTLGRQHPIENYIHKLRILAAHDNNVESAVVIEDRVVLPWLCEISNKSPDILELDSFRIMELRRDNRAQGRYDDDYEYTGGEDTKDKVFLPAHAENWGGHFVVKFEDASIHVLAACWGREYSSGLAWYYLAAGPNKEIVQKFLIRLKTRQKELRYQQIKSSIFNGSDYLTPRPNLDWDSVVLPKGVREKIEINVESFFKAKEVYKNAGLAYRRGILLVGPPGQGKSSILKVIASKYREYAYFLYGFSANEEDVKDNLISTFKVAESLAPAIVVLEDVDRLVKGNFMRTFLNILDGVVPQEGILVIASSNKPEELDPALTERPSRFDVVVRLDFPDVAQRKEYLQLKLADKFSVTDEGLNRLVDMTDKYSMAMLQEIHAGALLEHVRSGEPLDIKLLEVSVNRINESRKIVKDTQGKSDPIAGFSV